MALAPENQFVRDALTLVHFHRGDKDLFLKHVEETAALLENPYAKSLLKEAIKQIRDSKDKEVK